MIIVIGSGTIGFILICILLAIFGKGWLEDILFVLNIISDIFKLIGSITIILAVIAATLGVISVFSKLARKKYYDFAFWALIFGIIGVACGIILSSLAQSINIIDACKLYKKECIDTFIDIFLHYELTLIKTPEFIKILIISSFIAIIFSIIKLIRKKGNNNKLKLIIRCCSFIISIIIYLIYYPTDLKSFFDFSGYLNLYKTIIK